MFNIKSLDRHFCAFEYISSCKSIQWGDYPFILIASTRSTYCEWKYVNVLLCTSILKHIRNKFCLIPPHIHRCCMRSEKNLLNTILKLFRKSLTTAKVLPPYVKNDYSRKILFFALLYRNFTSNGAYERRPLDFIRYEIW